MDRLEEPVVEILDPLRPHRHLCIDHHDDFVERQAARLVFRQQRTFFSPRGLAAALEGVLADGLGPRDHGLCGLADSLAQLLDGLFVRGGEVEFHARVALQRAASVLTIDFIEGGDGLGDDRQVTAIGPQGLDALDDDGHFSESVKLVEHDHDGPGLIGSGVLFLHGGEEIGEEQPDQRRERLHHQRLDDEIDREGLLADCPEIKVRHRRRLIDGRVLPLVQPRGHQERDVGGQRVVVR